jgi:diketogulonate reductase-like aldo/keto reductase
MMTLSPGITLNNGVSIPRLGLGVFQVPPAEAKRVVETALEAGYRHIDTAAAYNNETGVGAAIKASGLPRQDIFVTSKLRNGNQGYNEALVAYDESCERLGLEQIDMYLIHWPYPSADRYVDSWRALERLHGEQRVRAVGVSNFLPEHLERLLAETGLVPAVNQIELHPTFQQREVADFSMQHSIAVESYSPLGQGADLEHPTVVGLAEQYSRTPAQVVLRWHLQRGHIVIPKSNSADRIKSNIDVFGFSLTDDEMNSLTALEGGNRIGSDPRTFALSQIR